MNTIFMIRTIITPHEQDISIQLPKEYLGKRVEVIAFTFDETSSVVESPSVPMTHFASEKVLAKDWLTEQEDEAWQDL